MKSAYLSHIFQLDAQRWLGMKRVKNFRVWAFNLVQLAEIVYSAAETALRCVRSVLLTARSSHSTGSVKFFAYDVTTLACQRLTAAATALPTFECSINDGSLSLSLLPTFKWRHYTVPLFEPYYRCILLLYAYNSLLPILPWDRCSKKSW